MFESFDSLFHQFCYARPPRAVLVGGEDYPMLSAAIELTQANTIELLVLGNRAEIKKSLIYCNSGYIPEIEHTTVPQIRAAELVSQGQADLLIQGSLTAKELLRPFQHPDVPLTQLYLSQQSGYHKLISLCCPPVSFPTEQKCAGIHTAVDALQVLGWNMPSVAVLCEQEELDPKVPATFVASELDRMRINGEIDWCRIYGPLSYDIAIDATCAKTKRNYAFQYRRPDPSLPDMAVSGLEGYYAPYCGNFDLLVAPDPISGHLLAGCWRTTVGATVCPLVVGGQVPFAMRARGGTVVEAAHTIRLAAMLARRST